LSLTKAKILIVDDEEAIREVVSTLLEAQDYECASVSNGVLAQEYLGKHVVDIVLSDMVMPEMDGMRLVEWLHKTDPDIPIIMVTANGEIGTALEAIRQGAYDYIIKPFEKDQLYFSVQRAVERRQLVLGKRDYQRNLEDQVEERTAQLKDALEQLEKSYDDTLEALGSALDMKDTETEGHSKRVTAYTIAIAKTMKVDPTLLPQIARAAFLHDIGKMAISDQILRKPGPLTTEERDVMRTHCEIGFKIVTRISFLKEAAEIVLSHQEYFDGTGYPRGLRGDQIPLGARIFAVADALDAMISDRPYRSALSITYAQEEIKRCSGTQFDPKVVEVFLAMSATLWSELRENIGRPYRLSQLRTL
jgi:putative nucleotidyltransferase with HDIG domain